MVAPDPASGNRRADAGAGSGAASTFDPDSAERQAAADVAVRVIGSPITVFAGPWSQP